MIKSIPLPQIHLEKFIVIFGEQKIYLNAKQYTTDRHNGVYRFFDFNETCIATFPIDITGIILNNQSK